MKIHSIIAMAFLAASALTGTALAQSDSAVDPACLNKNADGSNAVDRTKCPDGMKPTVSGPEPNPSPTRPLPPRASPRLLYPRLPQR